MGNLRIPKNQCQIKSKFVYIPREVIVEVLKSQPEKVRVEPAYLTREDVEDGFFPYFKEKHLDPVHLVTFLYLNALRTKKGERTLTAYAKLLGNIRGLLDKYGALMLNVALLAPKNEATATINYLKGVLRNLLKQQLPAEQPTTGKIRITKKNVTKNNIGTYVSSLSGRGRVKLGTDILFATESLFNKQQFKIAWQNWKQKGFANDFKHPNYGLRSLVAGFVLSGKIN